MWDKKGDYGFPIYFVPVLAIFVIVLIIFSALFFASNIIKSPNLIIKSVKYQDSSKVLTILKSVVPVENKNITIAELISLAFEDSKYEGKLGEEIKTFLSKLPKPQRKEDLTESKLLIIEATKSSLQKANWILEIESNGRTIAFGEKSTFGMKYFLQNAIIPLSFNNIAKIKLYLDCFSCSEEGINAIA
ncbi:hypothetical protein J4230_05680 [Candidatus Woesearchaeota archaeon]|nr:hypothetical protein [Candidatus Woesearchaeota archaeon]